MLSLDKLALLSQSPLFEMLRDQELTYLDSLVHARSLAAGEVLFEEGEVGDSLYLVESGEVEVQHRGQGRQLQTLAVLGPLECFGEMGMLLKDARSASVRARGAVALWVLSAEDLTTFRKVFPDGYALVILNLARILAGRLRDTSAQLTRALEGGAPEVR